MAFAWCSDESLCMARMFPEYIACDTIFVVTKEQSNLFVVAGIDGHYTVLTDMHYVIPLNETKAYHLTMLTVLRHLVTDKTLSFNQRIICNQELAIFQLLRTMIATVPCLNKYHSRLDKYHVLTQKWAA